MTTRETPTHTVPATVTCAGRTYSIDADCYCAELRCYFARMPNGKLVTIPVD